MRLIKNLQIVRITHDHLLFLLTKQSKIYCNSVVLLPEMFRHILLLSCPHVTGGKPPKT